MLNLLKNNLFDYYSRNSTCTGCLLDKYSISPIEYDKLVRETGLKCSFCFYFFLQMLKQKNNKSYKKLLNYIVENNNIVYSFPCNYDNYNRDSEEMKQIILNSIVAAELDIE
jgi:Fe-S oxidoreductase